MMRRPALVSTNACGLTAVPRARPLAWVCSPPHTTSAPHGRTGAPG